MLKVARKRQILFCHGQYFKNIKPIRGERLNKPSFSKNVINHFDSFHIFLKEVK